MNTNMTARDFNQEYKDGKSKYAYDFDSILRRYMLRALEPFFPAGPALEMGCFEGQMTEMLSQRFPDLTVIEASGELVKAACERVGSDVRFVNARFEAADFEPRFGSIFLIHTLEHVDEPAAVLSKVNEWLAPNGRLFLVVPNANAPSRQIAVHMGLISHNSAVTDAEREHGHRRTYSMDTLERDALAGGLTVINRGGVFFKPLANYQFDKLIGGESISADYLEGCYRLGMRYPDLCASIYVVCEKGRPSV
jgi:2-polyprenyl-3-methyl-5-hydroxy-6-metoxy-1,4-benzoquinol methylase